MSNLYYERNKEEILKKARERYLKKQTLSKQTILEHDIKRLHKQIKTLQEKVEYYQEQARKYRTQRTEKNKIIKNLEEKLKNTVPKQTGTNYYKTMTKIEKLQELLKNTQQPHILYQARLKQLNQLKQSIGMPIYSSCFFKN